MIAAAVRILLLACFAASALSAPPGEVREHRIGVLAYRPKPATLDAYRPTAEYLTRTLPGHRFEILPLDHGELAEAVASKRIDYVLTNPESYIVLEARHRVTRIATLVLSDGGMPLKEFGGVILVRADRDDLKSPRDLKGRTLAGVSPTAFGGYLMQAGALLDAGVDVRTDATLTFMGLPQDGIVQAVAEGRADAGFVRTGVLESLVRKGRIRIEDFRVINPRTDGDFPFLLSTRLYPEWPFASMPHTSDALAKEVLVALLRMPPDSEAAKKGGYHSWAIPLSYEIVHELMKNLRVTPYDRPAVFNLRDVLRKYEAEAFALLAAVLAATLFAALRFLLLSRRLSAAAEALRLDASVFSNALEGIVVTDPDGSIVNVNEAFTTLTGYSRDEVLGRNPRLLKSGRQDEAFYEDMWKGLVEQGHWRGEIWNRRKDGSLIAEILNIGCVRDTDGRITHYVCTFNDITGLKETQARLERAATFDDLTGLPNRVLLTDRMNQAQAQSLRRGDLLAVCFLDLDGFKPINDGFGHKAGDLLLCEVARRLEASLRAGDTVARIGGDEFALLLTGIRVWEEIDQTLHRMLGTLAAPYVIDGKRMQITASIGITLYPIDDADADMLLRHADHAMYRAKQEGRNRLHLFETTQDERL